MSRNQILAKAPDHIGNKELWFKLNEYLWIFRLGILYKLSKEGIHTTLPKYHNKLYDSDLQPNTDNC